MTSQNTRITNNIATWETLRSVLPVTWRRWIAFVAFWTLFGTISSYQWLGTLEEVYGLSPAYIFSNRMIKWLIWGILITPLILWLTSSFPLSRQVLWRNLTVLLLAGLGIPLAFVLFSSAMETLIYSLGSESVTWGNHDQIRTLRLMNDLPFFIVVFAFTVGIEYVFRGYKQMHVNIKLESQLVEARLETLKSQVHPHFLFNTLNTIQSMILTRNPRDAHDTIGHLADLLRIGMEHSSERFVTLESELIYIHHYLDIISERFGERLRIGYEIDANTKDALIPSMILQPLVENAVKYGVAAGSETGFISVSTRINSKRIVISVANSCDSQVEINGNSVRQGHGLGNTLSRLKCLYDEDFDMKLSRDNDEAIIVRLSIPFQKQRSEE